MVAVIVMAVVWLLHVMWLSPHRGDLATYGAFAVAVIALAGSWIAWAWRRGKPTAAGRDAGGADLDRVAGLLAEAVRKQWDRAAGERGLAGAEPIAVTWGRPALPWAGFWSGLLSRRSGLHRSPRPSSPCNGALRCVS